MHLSLTLCMMSLCSIIITSLHVCIYSCSIGLFVICPDDGNRMVTETLANIYFLKMASDDDKLQNKVYTPYFKVYTLLQEVCILPPNVPPIWDIYFWHWSHPIALTLRLIRHYTQQHWVFPPPLHISTHPSALIPPHQPIFFHYSSHSCLMQFRERDMLEGIFKFWRLSEPNTFDIQIGRASCRERV